MNRSLQVGITGGIGSGKSLVCHIFQCLGVPVYDADSQARKLMTSDIVLIAQIKMEFGIAAYQPDGSLDRNYLSKCTFGHPDRLHTLNSLVHPRVAEDYQQWARAHANHSYVLREAALLYEAGSYTSVDKMIVVTAPEKIRVERVIARDLHRTQDDIRAIMKNQWPEEEKLKRADYVIYNDDLHPVMPQVLHLHQLFLSLKSGEKSGSFQAINPAN